MKPLFSIIVPIYKVETYLDKCIDSILKQSFKDFELILVDDGSPDKCPMICDKYAKKDKRVKVIHKKNGGLVNAKNKGLSIARGEYTFYVDGDDWIIKDALSILYKKSIKDSNPDMIITNMTKVYSNRQEEIPQLVKEGYYDKKKLNEEIYPYMIYDKRKKFYSGLIFPSSGGKIIKTSILKKHKCSNEKIRMGEDNAYIFECAYYSNSIYFLDDHIYMYMQYDTSMAKSYDKNRFDNNKLLNEYIIEHLYGVDERIDYQLNVFKAYWLIMAIFHEIKCKRPIINSKKHIKNKIKETKVLESINSNKLPLLAKGYIFLLRLNLYYSVLLLTTIIQMIREKR